MTSEQQRQFLDELVLPLFANRRGKGHAYLDRFALEDFKVVNDVMDNFAAERMKAYFRKPTLAFLFVWFNRSKEGKKFALDKFTS